jgi:hypothetical protein
LVKKIKFPAQTETRYRPIGCFLLLTLSTDH